MNVELFEDVVIETTKDCVDLLNTYKQGNWKRQTKFTLIKKQTYKPESIVRVFYDGEEYATIISSRNSYSGDYTILCKNLDLRVHRDLIKAIQKKAESFYTHDYGEIFFNPYTMKLLIVGGDGGIFYSKGNKEEIAKKFIQGEDCYDDFEDVEFQIEGIVDCEYADEYYPKTYDNYDNGEITEEDDYIQIGNIVDLCCVEVDDDVYDNYLNGNPNNSPPKQKTIPELEIDLQRAIDVEDYELCARIRDEINKLKGE
jgi:hypothetical protein